MPQASQVVLDDFRKFFGEDADEWDGLHYIWGLEYYAPKGNFLVHEDVFLNDPKLRAALLYLQDGWDYGWEYL